MQSLKRSMLIFVGATAFLSGLSGAGIAYNITPRQNVVKVIETQTQKVVVQREVRVKEKIKEVVKPGCSDGKAGTVQSLHIDKMNVATKEEPNAWGWLSTVALNVDGEIIVCEFELSEMAKVLKPGDNFNPNGGRRM